MVNTNDLLLLFNLHFAWHPSRVQCLIFMIVGMINARSTQCQLIASFFKGNAKLCSVTKRIQRFFKDQAIDQASVARLIISFMKFTGCQLHLAIDRTNWKFGKTNINYLVLAVVFGKKCALPLFWTLLPKRGNSSTPERINLLEKFIDTFGVQCIASLTGDREFIGEVWFQYLCEAGIPFYIRIKENALTDWNATTKFKISEFFGHLKIGATRMLYEKNIYGQMLVIAGTRSVSGELVLICTNCEHKSAKTILKIYKKRWCIETAFKAMKSKGVNIEGTHMTDPERLSKLLAVIALANTLCTSIGQANEKGICFKKTVNAPLYSIFQWGFILLRRFLNGDQPLIPFDPKPPSIKNFPVSRYALRNAPCIELKKCKQWLRGN